MDDKGGGWTLVMSRNLGDPTAHTSDLLLPADDNKALTNDRWVALRGVCTESMGSFNAYGIDYLPVSQIADLEAANCAALRADLTQDTLVHDEVNLCDGYGGDYRGGFGICTPFCGLNTAFYDFGRGLYVNGPSYANPDRALMYVR